MHDCNGNGYLCKGEGKTPLPPAWDYIGTVTVPLLTHGAAQNLEVAADGLMGMVPSANSVESTCRKR